MHLSDFRDWFLDADAALAGAAPPLSLWWELKQRLLAVEEYAKLETAIDKLSLNLLDTSLPPSPNTKITDCPPAGGRDPEPSEFREFSRLKDGGLSALAVDLLRSA